ncbi:cytochrome P450 [Blastococcus sp. URHD0036]|uniref:cytochrome P450 n=1 Tax=Blastococcus sp. URHD0036 TaxID=1380356 RepID=UPI000495F2D4|nr:cytochrome P450 [Blastococcus sp. URHD0036]
MAVDLSDPKSFHHAVPHEEFERLRNEEPLSWTPTASGTATGGFWSLTRAADVAAASRDTQTFTSTLGICYPSNYEESAMMVDNVMFNDPPEHAQVRKLAGAAFTPRMVARFADWITERVDIILDGLEGRGECDLVPLIAVELPIQVICSVMGVPDEDRTRVVQWADEIFGREREDIGPERATAATMAVMQYAMELRAKNRDVQSDNMLGELASFERDGVKITDSQFMQMFMALLIAGFETTHTLISQSFRLMLEQPEIAEQARVAITEGRSRALVDEFLRQVTPAMHMARHATRDVEMHGKTIKKGDMVLLWFVSANRDAEVFTDPHTFNIDRRPNPHQAFGGGGPHFCIGAHLARLEVQILLERLVARDIRITSNGEPTRGWSTFINQLFALPVVCQ